MAAIELITAEILKQVDLNSKVSSVDLNSSKDQLEILGVLNSLKSKCIIDYKPITKEYLVLTDEGKEILLNGSHEVRVFNAIPKDGITPTELQATLGAIAKFGQAAAFKLKWIAKGGEGKLFRLVDSVQDVTQENLGHLEQLESSLANTYKKRKLILTEKSTSYLITKGEEFTTKIVDQETDVTFEMVINSL